MQSWALCFHYTFNVFLTCEIFCQFRKRNKRKLKTSYLKNSNLTITLKMLSFCCMMEVTHR